MAAAQRRARVAGRSLAGLLRFWKFVAWGLSVARMPQSEPMTHAHTIEPMSSINVITMYSA